ncbi:BLUF domain-containing protein [Enterovibrio makurazakiensis]|uniref:BLUF domain-containing protein n=1 Tax=Enterovibrio gelatinilyticus TaxID=2899819 RepID=A0ABT5R1H7_9GAMM|nr:BLUF domain-containing protein [Enterovibrio sp. ZSDZ42]MDD1794010.1 BLUF domain-containing protein [Enterovibrio sp. ZSDZ42]
MIRLIYASAATCDFSESKLMQLLGKARSNNETANVSGLLLYAKGNFFQVLEGEKSAVEVLFSRIQQDERHTSVVVLDRSEITHRNFPNWSMGFKNLEQFDKTQLRGYNDFLERQLTAEDFGEIGPDVIYLIEQFKRIW